MKIDHLLAELAGDGVVVFAVNGDIKLRHSHPLGQSLLEAVRNNKPEIIDYLNRPNYTLWFYKIGNQHGYTRMGLMTADSKQAQQQLETVYNKPITNLQREN